MVPVTAVWAVSVVGVVGGCCVVVCVPRSILYVVLVALSYAEVCVLWPELVGVWSVGMHAMGLCGVVRGPGWEVVVLSERLCLRDII